jgi:hypothetical protein
LRNEQRCRSKRKLEREAIHRRLRRPDPAKRRVHPSDRVAAVRMPTRGRCVEIRRARDGGRRSPSAASPRACALRARRAVPRSTRSVSGRFTPSSTSRNASSRSISVCWCRGGCGLQQNRARCLSPRQSSRPRFALKIESLQQSQRNDEQEQIERLHFGHVADQEQTLAAPNAEGRASVVGQP